MMTRQDLNTITREIIGAAIEVHRALGPGLLESAYEACLAFELAERGLKVEQQKPLPVTYKMELLLRLFARDEMAVVSAAYEELQGGR